MPSSPLGIQLGSTFCTAAIYHDSRVRLLEGPSGSTRHPCEVGITPQGQVVVGHDAHELRAQHPERTVTDFLRRLGRDHEIELAGHTFEATLLVSLVLAHIKSDAEACLDESVSDCVLAIPSWFDERRRLAMLRAASLAGLDVLRLLDEPLAAAWSYWPGGLPQGVVAVLDLGARNLDVSLIETGSGDSRLISVARAEGVGGECFTDRLLDWALRQAGVHLEYAELALPKYVEALRGEVEAAKCKLSDSGAMSVELIVPPLPSDPDSQQLVLELDEVRLEAICRSLTARLERPAQRALSLVAHTPADVDAVVLVGGAAPMPLAQGFAQQVFEQEINLPFDPSTAVARGAALQAARLVGTAPSDHTVSTVTFGVEVTRDLGEQTVAGYFLPLVPRGTPLPTWVTEELETTSEDQSEVRLRFFLGESSRVARNRFIGELVVPVESAGIDSLMQVNIHSDVGGVFALEVLDEDGENLAQAVFDSTGRRSTAEETTEWLAKLAEGRTEERVRTIDDDELERYTDQTLTLLSVRERWWLEQVLEAFREIRYDGPSITVELVRRDLLGLLDELGYSYEEGLAERDFNPKRWRILRPDSPGEDAA